MKRRTRKNYELAGKLAMGGLGAYAVARTVKWGVRASIAAMVKSFTERVLTDSYDENIWELFHATNRLTPQTVVETALRAQEGQVITRPLGSRRRFKELDDIFFDFAQLTRSTRPADLTVDTSVIIGPSAGRPMKLEIPIMISGMAYGLALSREAKIALARGARLAGTSTSSGEGIPAPGEMQEAGKYVLQLSRSCWNREESFIRRADMVELQFGQGASGGTGHPIAYKDLLPASRKFFGVHKKNQAVQVYSMLPEITQPKEVGKVVKQLRQMTDVPIGAKLGASKYLEEDMEILLEAGIDVIWLDGAQAGTHASAPILEDDMGLPTFYAVCRGADYLKKQGLQDKVSLVISGGLFTPGDFLKCLALGADAVGIGTTALLAISHKDVMKVLPWEPPTQLVYATGTDLGKFNTDQGAKGLYNFLMSCAEEMVLGARAMGRQSLQAVDRNDMMTTEPQVAEAAGIEMVGTPQPLGKGSALQPTWLRREHMLAHLAATDRARSHGPCGHMPALENQKDYDLARNVAASKT